MHGNGRALLGHAVAPCGADRVGDDALTVVDVADVDLLVFTNAAGVQQVFVDGAGDFLVEFAVGDRSAVDFGFEQGAQQGVGMKGSP